MQRKPFNSAEKNTCDYVHRSSFSGVLYQEESSVKQITRIYVDLKESSSKAAALGYAIDKVGSVDALCKSRGKKCMKHLLKSESCISFKSLSGPIQSN